MIAQGKPAVIVTTSLAPPLSHLPNYRDRYEIYVYRVPYGTHCNGAGDEFQHCCGLSALCEQRESSSTQHPVRWYTHTHTLSLFCSYSVNVINVKGLSSSPAPLSKPTRSIKGSYPSQYISAILPSPHGLPAFYIYLAYFACLRNYTDPFLYLASYYCSILLCFIHIIIIF